MKNKKKNPLPFRIVSVKTAKVIKRVKSENQEKGFSLVEVLIAVFVATLIGIGAVALLNARAVGINDKAETKEGETRAEEALSALTAVAPDLNAGGSFQVVSESAISLSACTLETCDYVVYPDATESQRTSLAKGFPYGSTIPSTSQMTFIRRWRVDEVDSNYGLRKITVAILKSETDTNPIVLEETVVGINR